ncbi:hypothetical protein AJ80_09240 [Polytolypa hystricis UAMH7299]|uniref:P-loop containing nucleoside triphosphate hydrolase protein n=1 Tax=Polytolypa hystricis (strain UAMH7299) TaxID=1447883 RepID=A0A2B7WTS9_POLH7|nr:hypothetical protein AJ80_09240 [Polytolypa hystricis UAMH7299]
MESNNTRPPIICILGPPAAGKGTLSSKLSKDYGLFHFSLGDYLRGLSNDEQCPVREQIIEFFRRGGLFPIEFLAPLIQEKLRHEYEKKNGSAGIILDGFPRSMEQLRGYGDCKYFDIVVFCDCPRDIIKHRYLSRRLPGRLEDDEALFDERYAEYEKLNPEVVDWFKQERTLIEVSPPSILSEPT